MATTVIVTDLGSEDDGMVPVYNHGKRGFEVKPIGGVVPTFNAQTGTSYTLLDSDIGKVITLTNADPITLTLPLDATLIPIGSTITLIQGGAGQVTIAPADGGTLNISGDFDAETRAIWSRVMVQKIAANTWLLWGDLTAAA